MRFLVIGLFVAALAAQTRPESATAGLQVRVGPACELAPMQTSTELPVTNSETTVFSGSTRLRYWVRTSRQGGDGNVSLRFEAPAGSKVSVRYTGGGPGIASVINEVPTDEQIVILVFGPNAHTSQAGAEGIVQWRVIMPTTILQQPSSPTASIQCR